MTKGNRQSRLQGFADPSDPDWRKNAMRRVMLRSKGSKRAAERDGGVLAVFDLGFRQLLDEACYRRGISLAGYARRAIAAMVAHDLGIPLAEALKHMPLPTEYRVYGGTGRNTKTIDTGEGFGPWHIEGVSGDGDGGTPDRV
jgi:hypothetical protein